MPPGEESAIRSANTAIARQSGTVPASRCRFIERSATSASTASTQRVPPNRSAKHQSVRALMRPAAAASTRAMPAGSTP